MKKNKHVKKIGENFFVKNYKLCYNFGREISWYFVFALGIFMFTFLIGFTYPHFFEEEIKSFIQTLTTSLDGKSVPYLISYIFANNIRAAFFSFILGITFGIFPLITLITNGYLLGFVSRIVSGEAGIFILWRLLPHGIFELPAILLSVGIGLKIGHDLISWKDRKNLKRDYVEGFRFFFLVILPLLIIAAIIEGVLIGIGV